MFLYLPFFSKMRVLVRFGVFTLTFMCLLAGIGSAWLFRRYPAQRYLLAGILLVGIALDVYPGINNHFTKVAARPVDFWLADQPSSGAVAQFPFIQEVDQDQVYYTLTHGKPFLGGFFNANQPPQYRRIKPVLDAFPDTASLALLKDLDIRYILVDSDRYPDFESVNQRIQNLGLRLEAVVENEYVYGWP